MRSDASRVLRAVDAPSVEDALTGTQDSTRANCARAWDRCQQRQRRAERSAARRGGPEGHSCCDAPVIVSKRHRGTIVAMCTSWIVKPETRAMGAQWMMGGECVER